MSDSSGRYGSMIVLCLIAAVATFALADTARPGPSADSPSTATRQVLERTDTSKSLPREGSFLPNPNYLLRFSHVTSVKRSTRPSTPPQAKFDPIKGMDLHHKALKKRDWGAGPTGPLSADDETDYNAKPRSIRGAPVFSLPELGEEPESF
jgi:hypothetical protein